MARKVLSLVFSVAMIAATPVAGDRGTPVGVLFRDAVDDCIMSDHDDGVDGSLEYVDGVEAVTARIHYNGSLGVSGRHTRGHDFFRRLWFNFSMPVEFGADGSVSPEHNPPTDLWWVAPTWTIDLTVAQAGGFLGMPVGSVSSGAASFGGFDDNNGWLYSVFNTAQHPGSTYVTVTRISDAAWTVEAYTTDVTELVEPGQRSKGLHTNRGYYCKVFQFTLRTLP